MGAGQWEYGMKGCLTLLCWLAVPAVLLGVFATLMGQDPIGAVLLVLLAILLVLAGFLWAKIGKQNE